MSVLTEGKYSGEFLHTESPGRISRDAVTVTVPANTTFNPGKVLGQVSATGKYVAFDDASSDGRETAAGVLFDKIVNDTDAAVDYDGVIINWGAEVRTSELSWDEGVDDAAGLADLAALGVKARS
ncbi:MAG: head decoration protein [Acidobacteriota bacterium]|nr:head decoration protein [Acidobacteriota bacterium]